MNLVEKNSCDLSKEHHICSPSRYIGQKSSHDVKIFLFYCAMRLIVRAFFLWGWGIDAPPIHTHGIFSLFSPNTLNDGPLLDTKISNFNLMKKKHFKTYEYFSRLC